MLEMLYFVFKQNLPILRSISIFKEKEKKITLVKNYKQRMIQLSPLTFFIV